MHLRDLLGSVSLDPFIYRGVFFLQPEANLNMAHADTFFVGSHMTDPYALGKCRVPPNSAIETSACPSA